MNLTQDDYFRLFGEGEAELEDDEDDEEEELELESERGDLLRYLLLSLPLAGLGGGVGRVHGAVLSSAARLQFCSVAELSEGDRTLSADMLHGCSERRCTADFAEVSAALMVVLTSQVEVCFLHSAAESSLVTCSSEVLATSLSLETLFC